MLRVIESRPDKAKAQALLVRLLKASWHERENRVIVWRPNSIQADVIHNDRFWFASLPPGGHEGTPRYWNPVGLYSPTGGLQITVELNVPSPSNTRRVSAFFARDDLSHINYLMHDGAVGGGFPGVGRAAFLRWSALKPLPVIDSAGRNRPAVIVAPLTAPALCRGITEFVRRVADFKRAARNGAVPTDPDAQEDEQSYENYCREFSGLKTAQRARELEYISRHGDIVDALKRWRDHGTGTAERVFNTRFIDLGVKRQGKIIEVYEVKTTAERQQLYTAIGQLVTHGNPTAKRYLVLPAGEALPGDIREALAKLGIERLTFTLNGDAVSIQSQSG